jgi:hypothetical protein
MRPLAEETKAMKFFFGIAVGALGMWAYQNGKFNSLMGSAPEPVRQFGATVQDRIQHTQPGEIVTPSAAEVSGRPSDPLPTPGA